MKLICKLITIISVLVFIWSCETPESLEPVSGIEGKLFVEGEWPDSIKATALIVLNSLDPGNLAAGIVTYSTPMLSPSKKSDYFFQLEPGFYFVAGVGLTMDPVLFFANFDSITASGNLPIVQLEKSPPLLKIIDLGNQQVIEIDHTITFK
ncbi:MAG: hypothetical protein HN665_00205 [Candidatus Marinimicrobia bacterium]|jgi:hypothetical protein|nr:hypothetical protein [Candidatus Neomarinimicrobiota bacterium]MBT4269901.1 hypothetical protein [Candidatus Neomarinimicrobiota bacterium]MBT7494842.1 hypothetical protein [Candidatus Neomarinimicrobiota bacterium]